MKLYTMEEAARELRVSVSFLQHLAARRGIGFTRLGRRSYFADEDLSEYIARQRVEPIEFDGEQ